MTNLFLSILTVSLSVSLIAAILILDKRGYSHITAAKGTDGIFSNTERKNRHAKAGSARNGRDTGTNDSANFGTTQRKQNANHAA